MKTTLCAKKNGLKANRSKCVQWTFQLRFVEFPEHLTHQEMFTTWQFFAPFNNKYLGSTMKNIENSRTILSIYNLFWKQYTIHWIILKRLRATTVTRPPNMRVANDDLSVSSRKSIEILVFCRLEMGNCVHFLLGRTSISLCWPMRVVKTDIYL